MIEGPGHVPLNQVETNMKIQKALCKGAPFYVLGPLVTDVAPGYDHITSAIGGAIAARRARTSCAMSLRRSICACLTSRTCAGRHRFAHRGARRGHRQGRQGCHGLGQGDGAASEGVDWKGQIELSMNPERARKLRESSLPKESDVCSMCGEFCSMKGGVEVSQKRRVRVKGPGPGIIKCGCGVRERTTRRRETR